MKVDCFRGILLFNFVTGLRTFDCVFEVEGTYFLIRNMELYQETLNKTPEVTSYLHMV